MLKWNHALSSAWRHHRPRGGPHRPELILNFHPNFQIFKYVIFPKKEILTTLFSRKEKMRATTSIKILSNSRCKKITVMRE